MPIRIDTPLLFPSSSGQLWHESNFPRDVWAPAVARQRAEEESAADFQTRRRAETQASPRAIRLHDCRHSWITHPVRGRHDDADLAAVAGHAIDTMLGTYTHPLGRSHERIRAVIG